MRPLILISLILALALPNWVAAQQGPGDDGGGEDRGETSDSNDTNNAPWPPRRLRTPPPGTVIIVPAPKPTRRIRPKPPKRVVVRTPPGNAVLDRPIDITHSVRTPLIRGDVRLLPDGGLEFIAVGPRAESAAAVIAMTDAGAAFLRQRNYPNLDLRALVFDTQNLTLPQIRALLAFAAPGTGADTHAIYRLAAGEPRLYAAALVTPPDVHACNLANSVRIGQIDGPVANDHAALKGTGLVSHSVLDEATAPPRKDHGTAVAALLTGQDATGALAGFASGAQLYAASAFGAEGASGASDIERITSALDWLAGEQVQLINLSFAGPVNTALEVVLNTVAEKNIILIAAAGNQGSETAVYPAAAAQVIGVTAVDAAMRRYRAANTGTHVDFAAPGVDLYVASEEGGGYASGTSYAAPILTGLAARLVAQGVSDLGDLRARLQSQSVDLGDAGRDSAFGWGLVKASGC